MLFAAGMLLHVIIHKVYPYGLIFPDTHPYFVQVENFKLLEPNPVDWFRTPVFGFLQLLAMRFPQPTVFLFWLHSFLFSAGIALVPWLIAPAFRSHAQALLLGSGMLIVETLIMRVPFHSLVINSDPSYSHLLFIGLLFVAGGFLRAGKSPWMEILGYAVIGLAAFERQSIAALFIVLFPWAVFSAWMRTGSMSKARSWIIAGVCCTFLILPSGLWVVRNKIVYNHFNLTASAGHHILPSLLEFTQDGDRLIPDAEDNELFIRRLRAHEERFPVRDADTYRWLDTANPEHPFNLLPVLARRYALQDGVSEEDVAGEHIFFYTNDLKTAMALRIMVLHPVDFLLQTGRLYIRHFSSASLRKGDYYLNLDLDGQRYAHLSKEAEFTSVLPLYYPSVDLAAVHSTVRMGYVLRALQMRSLYDYVIPRQALVIFLVVHILAACALVCARLTSDRRIRNTSLVILLLLSVAGVQYLFSTVAGIVLERYILPGEMLIRLALMMFLLAILPYFIRGRLYPQRDGLRFPA